MQANATKESTSRPIGFYFLAVFLLALVSGLGWEFGGVKGMLIGLFFAVVVDIYAFQIKND